MSSRFEFRGDLATTPLAEVLQTVHRYRVPGVVTMSRGGVEKKVFIWRGDVIFASSADLADSLGQHLLRTGMLSEPGLARSVQRLVGSAGTKRHGAILVEMGLLTGAKLRWAVLEQVRAIVASLFDWEGGDVTFRVGEYRTDELIQLKIPTRHIILEGIKAMRDVRRLVSALGPSWTVFAPSYSPAEIGDIGLGPGEVEFLGRIDGVRTLRELVAAGPGDAAHNAKLVYAFCTLKLIAKRDPEMRGIKRLHWRSPGSGYHAGG